jgi:hypothetical protein
MQMMRDASVKITKALPNGSYVGTSAGLDIGKTSALGDKSQDVEFLLSAPALTAAEAPDGRTLTYAIKWSENADLSAPTTYMPAAIIQTGAGGAGAAAATFTFRVPSTAGRYLFLTITGNGEGDASGSAAAVEMLF